MSRPPPPLPDRRLTVPGGPTGTTEVEVVEFDDLPGGPRVVEATLPGDRSSLARAWVGRPADVSSHLDSECDAPEAARLVASSPAPSVGVLEWVGVARARRGARYGSALLAASLRELDRLGARATWLKVGQVRTPDARRAELAAWYARGGFASGPRPSEWVMVRAAPPPAPAPEDPGALAAAGRGWPDPRGPFLYHGTLRSNVPGILARGLVPAVGPLTRLTFGDLGPLAPLVFASPSLAVARQAIVAQASLARGVPRDRVTDAVVRRVGAVAVLPRDGFTPGYSNGARPAHAEEADWYSDAAAAPLARVWGDDLDLLFAAHGLRPLGAAARGWRASVARWLAGG